MVLAIRRLVQESRWSVQSKWECRHEKSGMLNDAGVLNVPSTLGENILLTCNPFVSLIPINILPAGSQRLNQAPQQPTFDWLITF